MDVQLVDSATNKSIAILFDVEAHLQTLNHIRSLIAEQVLDLLPSDKYAFLHQGGIKVSGVLEHELTLEQIFVSESVTKYNLGDDDSPSNLVLLSFGECLYDVVNYKPTTTTDNTGTTFDTAMSLSSSATPEEKQTIKMLALKSPTTAELRGLKIYAENDIKKGKGSQQMYRQFWNKKIKEFAKNRALSNEEICKRVNEEWRLHRTTLLVKESKDVDEALSRYMKSEGDHKHDGPKAKKMKARTLPSNVSRLNAAVHKTEDLTVQISSKNNEMQNAVSAASKEEIKADLSCLQASLDSTKSEVRKAQDTLRKNIQKKQSEIRKYFRK